MPKVTPSNLILVRPLLRTRLAGNTKPGKGDNNPKPSADTESACISDLIEECTAYKATDEESRDSDDLEVSAFVEFSSEELGLGHEFTPDGSEYDYNSRISFSWP